MPLKSATDATFLETLQEWLRSQTEILVVIRYSRAAGNKSFEFFTSFALVEERVRQLAPETNIIGFRKPQLTIRGIVDDGFIGSCLNSIADGNRVLSGGDRSNHCWKSLVVSRRGRRVAQ